VYLARANNPPKAQESMCISFAIDSSFDVG
jgi:hypothetical protein